MADLFEVEDKYPLRDVEPAGIEARLRELGFVFIGERVQYDYFIPGTRKGEMLRVRVENGQYWQTVKERIKIDGSSTRRESEPLIHPIAGRLIIAGANRALEADTPSMYKRRRDFRRSYNDFEVNVVLDYVPSLDQPYSSYFMEVEIIVDDPSQVEEAKKMVAQVAVEILGEKREPTKLSYRRMLFRTMRARGTFPKRWKALAGNLTGEPATAVEAKTDDKDAGKQKPKKEKKRKPAGKKKSKKKKKKEGKPASKKKSKKKKDKSAKKDKK